MSLGFISKSNLEKPASIYKLTEEELKKLFAAKKEEIKRTFISHYEQTRKGRENYRPGDFTAESVGYMEKAEEYANKEIAELESDSQKMRYFLEEYKKDYTSGVEKPKTQKEQDATWDDEERVA